MPQARKIILAKRFDGAPTLADFQIVEETLPDLQDGEVLCKAEWFTVDPYMRFAANGLKVGDQMMGTQVAKVLRSRHPDFPEGSQVVGNFGWRDLTVSKVPPKEQRTGMNFYGLPDMKGLPDSYALGALGMPGMTAYFGLTEICKPKTGETLVVTAAAGAVGSLVGQIGKILGLKVIGYAGSDEKVEWVKSLGFDHVHNYKTEDIPGTLKASASKGIDCYFDNIGGTFTYNVMQQMNSFGRIALCGAISSYNDDPKNPTLVPIDYVSMIYKNISYDGFVVVRWGNQWFDGIKQMQDWVLQGKVKVEEWRVPGFENIPQAFIDLLAGKNTGKVIIQA